MIRTIDIYEKRTCSFIIGGREPHFRTYKGRFILGILSNGREQNETKQNTRKNIYERNDDKGLIMKRNKRG